MELLSEDGNVSRIPYEDIKTISFVREFDDFRRLDRRVFNTRPKMEGLWISLEFRDGEMMEGVMPNNLLQVEQHGFMVIPPDSVEQPPAGFCAANGAAWAWKYWAWLAAL